MAKHELYKQMYSHYLEGYSLSEIGKMFGVTRQSVYEGFRCRGYKLREKKKLPFLTFNGVKFTLRNNGYYGRTDGDRELMHRYVWRYYKGDIPISYDIHHKNHNKADNDINNLELISKSEHAKKYSTGNNQFTKIYAD
jgi:hypothetical protein